MLQGFRDVVMRGNIIELGIAVVIGVAFTALVATITEALIQPLINIFLGGGVSWGTFTLRGQVFDVGAVLNAAITFLITAAVVYLAILVPIRQFEAMRDRGEPAPKPAPSSEELLLAEIRDLLRSGARD